MTDFAAAGETYERPVSPTEIWREVIMQQEVLLVGSFQCVNELLVITGAKRGYNQRLGFTSGKQGGTMGARQNADFTNLI